LIDFQVDFELVVVIELENKFLASGGGGGNSQHVDVEILLCGLQSIV